MLNLRRGLGRERNRALRFVGLGFGAQVLPRSRNRKALLVQQLLDAQHILDVAPAVHALSSAALDGLQLRELGLPEAEHIGRQMTESGYFSDAEIKFVGNDNFIRLMFRRACFPRSHLFRAAKPRCSLIVTQVRRGITKFRDT